MEKAATWGALILFIALFVWLLKYDGCATIQSYSSLSAESREHCESRRDDCEDTCSSKFHKKPNARQRCNDECSESFKLCVTRLLNTK